MKPVYILNGFLESGKTEFITYTLDQPYFQIQGKKLIIRCEDGENGLLSSAIFRHNVSSNHILLFDILDNECLPLLLHFLQNI